MWWPQQTVEVVKEDPPQLTSVAPHFLPFTQTAKGDCCCISFSSFCARVQLPSVPLLLLPSPFVRGTCENGRADVGENSFLFFSSFPSGSQGKERAGGERRVAVVFHCQEGRSCGGGWGLKSDRGGRPPPGEQPAPSLSRQHPSIPAGKIRNSMPLFSMYLSRAVRRG